MLQNTVDISRQATNLMKAGNLPQVMLTGGYAVSNPNTFNGFERKFGGFWNVGVLVRVPVWNWGDVRYKVRASKGLTDTRKDRATGQPELFPCGRSQEAACIGTGKHSTRR